MNVINVSITVFFHIFLNCISSRFRLILETCEKPKMLDRVGKYPRFVFRKYLVHRCIFEIPKYSGLTLIFWTSIVSKCYSTPQYSEESWHFQKFWSFQESRNSRTVRYFRNPTWADLTRADPILADLTRSESIRPEHRVPDIFSFSHISA